MSKRACFCLCLYPTAPRPCVAWLVQMEPLLSGTGSFGKGDLLADALDDDMPAGYIPYSYEVRRPQPPGGDSGVTAMSPRSRRVAGQGTARQRQRQHS